MIGTYYTEDLMQKWFVRNLSIAREVLKNFRSLNELLKGFENYEAKRYRDVRNAIMFMCLPEVRGGINGRAVNRLAVLEKAIQLFGVMNWGAKKLTRFRSRLASEKYIQSFSVVTELEGASKMVERLGKDNVELYPRLASGRFSDIRVTVNGKNVFLEVGNLDVSLPEKKIQQIINESARHLGEKISAQCYLQLIIDTAEIVFSSEGEIEVDASIIQLNSEIDMLNLHKLAGFKGFFHLNDVAYIVANLLTYENMKQWLTPHDRKLLNLINDKKVKSWLRSFDTRLLEKARLVKGIIASPGTSTLLVEIHIQSFFPSKAAISERESFLNHIVRNIDTQIKERQLQPNAPNIILVQGHHWTMFGFDLGPLYNQMQSFFEKRREANLSGVVIFGREFEKAVYACNNYASKSSQLSREDIAKLGFRWLEFS